MMNMMIVTKKKMNILMNNMKNLYSEDYIRDSDKDKN